jgi:hypothetical protein
LNFCKSEFLKLTIFLKKQKQKNKRSTLGRPVQATAQAGGGKREATQFNKSYTPPFATWEALATDPAPHWPGLFNPFLPLFYFFFFLLSSLFFPIFFFLF